jgi:fructose-1,6-bisphosphatase/inositol monophosphatase family enzyme
MQLFDSERRRLRRLHRLGGTIHRDELRLALESAAVMGEAIRSRPGKILRPRRERITTTVERELVEWFANHVANRRGGAGVVAHGLVRERHRSRLWVVDPIAGTWAYLRGLPLAMVTVACVDDGWPTVAVAYNPWTRDCLWSVRGLGTYRNAAPVSVQPAPRDDYGDRPPLLISDGGTRSAEGDMAPPLVTARLLPEPALMVLEPWEHGRLPYALAAANVISGWDGAVFPDADRIDLAAVSLLVKQAGGCVFPERFDATTRGGAFAATKQVHDVLRARLQHVLDRKN